jgi:hypothetical protein
LTEVVEEQVAHEARPCFRHPKEMTLLACGRCARPICTKCVVMGPAGPRCPDCARQNVKVSARGVSHDLTSGIRRMFGSSPFGIYIGIVLALMILGWVRSCMMAPRVIVVDPNEDAPRSAPDP